MNSVLRGEAVVGIGRSAAMPLDFSAVASRSYVTEGLSPLIRRFLLGLQTVWRSFFLAVGIMLIILGIECLMIDSATVFAAGGSEQSNFMDPTRAPDKATKEVQPSEWMPWTMLSGGTVVVLYAITLPRRWGSGE